jgi:hypothetical protein
MQVQVDGQWHATNCYWTDPTAAAARVARLNIGGLPAQRTDIPARVYYCDVVWTPRSHEPAAVLDAMEAALAVTR